MKNTYYYLFLVLIFVLAKFWLSSCHVDNLDFILKPVSVVVGSFTNSNISHVPEKGYYFRDINILINKACSGCNFMLLSFSMLFILAIEKNNDGKRKLLLIVLSLLLSYGFTILVNTSRILLSIYLSDYSTSYSWFHEAMGSFVYLSSLITIYFIANYFFTSKTKLYA